MWWMMRSVVRSASGAGVDGAAVAQDGDAIADRAQFVQPVRDVDDAHLALAQRAHDAEDFRRLGARERRRGLVEDQQARAVQDGAADLDQLLSRRAELFHAPLRAQREVVLLDQRGWRASIMRRRFTQPSGSRSSRPRKMFSATVRCGASSDSWWTMAMPMAAASAGVFRWTSRPCHSIWPASRSTHSGDDFHQRGFAGAVFAEQQVHFAGLERTDCRPRAL